MDQTQNQTPISEETIATVLNDATTQQMIQDAMQKAITKAVENSFNSYNPVGKAIEKKIEEILVPAVEAYDMSAYVPKLDAILTEIAKSPACSDVAKTANNFKELFVGFGKAKYTLKETTTRYGQRTATLEEIFEAYKKFIEEYEFDRSDLEVYDSESYGDVACSCDVEDVSPERYSSRKMLQVTLHNSVADEHDGDGHSDTCFVLTLTQWDFMRNEGTWDLTYAVNPSLNSIRHMSDFEIFLLKIMQNHIDITDPRDFEDSVTLKMEPEANVSYE